MKNLEEFAFKYFWKYLTPSLEIIDSVRALVSFESVVVDVRWQREHCRVSALWLHEDKVIDFQMCKFPTFFCQNLARTKECGNQWYRLLLLKNVLTIMWTNNLLYVSKIEVKCTNLSSILQFYMYFWVPSGSFFLQILEYF